MEREKLIQTVTAAQQGDTEALNTLFNAFYNDVYYSALKTVKDDTLACDITQETFIEVLNTLDKLQEPAAFVTWLKSITYHQCTRHFRKKKDVLVEEDEEGNTIFDTLAEDRAEFIPDEALDQEDFRQTILAMIDQLSDEQRAAVMMHYFDEFSVKQIAEIQGVSEGTVKSRLNYARKAIKTSVEEYEKKNDIKLHSFGILPLLLWLFGGNFSKTMSAASAEAVAAGVSAATGTAIAISSASAATATVAATTTVSIGAKIAALPIVTKVIAGIAAVAIAVGGGIAVSEMVKPEDPTTPPAYEAPSTPSGDATPTTPSAPVMGEIDYSNLEIAAMLPQNVDKPIQSRMSPMCYPGMPYYDSPDQLTPDQAARLMYSQWCQLDAEGHARYRAIRSELFNQLCQLRLNTTYDVTQLTGEYAIYDPALDAVIMTCEDPFTWQYAMSNYIPVYEENSYRWYDCIVFTQPDGTFVAALKIASTEGNLLFSAMLAEDPRCLELPET